MISPHWYYLLVDLGCFTVPFIFSFHPRLRFYQSWRMLLPALAVLLLVFIPWDVFFTAKGIWGFNPAYVTGVWLFGLPLEEWLFFVCIPYACLFTYHCFGILFSRIPWEKSMIHLTWICAIGSVSVCLFNTGRWYTFAAHFACALLLFVHLIWLKRSCLARFIFMYIAVLPAFLASNGILTGLKFWKYPFFNANPETIADQIVWYDNTHNLGLRLFSMPVDDLAYGMTMLLLTVTVYEGMKARRNATPQARA
jgi:lycopene cyclase domain-containing protein